MPKSKTIFVDILAVLFGISSWIAINGVWTQTPMLAIGLPEQFNIGVYIVIIVQLANIGPITYSILKSYFSVKSIEMPAIHLTLAIGSIACLLLSLFWDKITQINGSSHSVIFLGLTSLLAVIDCTTSVLYMPYMTHFKHRYLIWYMFGQNLSGLLPSGVALIQGTGGKPECVNATTNSTIKFAKYPEPLFSVNTFFLFLLCSVLISWFAFVLLNNLNICKSERVIREDIVADDVCASGVDIDLQQPNVRNSSVNSELELTENTDQNMSRKSFITLLATQAFICSLTNGILPSIQSYSCAPYGNTSYHLAVNLSSIAGPIGCFIAFFTNPSTVKRTLPVTTCLGSICAAYLIATALLSPTPPLQNSIYGQILIVLTWVTMSGLFSYCRTCIATTFRNTIRSHNSLFICGVLTQIGSSFGAILIFCLLEFTKLFTYFNVCA